MRFPRSSTDALLALFHAMMGIGMTSGFTLTISPLSSLPWSQHRRMSRGRVSNPSPSFSPLAASAQNQQDEVEALRERARKIREEVAALEGRSVVEVEEEARQKQRAQQELRDRTDEERSQRKAESEAKRAARRTDGSFLQVPETHDDQVFQAKAAIERAFADGHTRQLIRWAFVPEDEMLHVDRQWPGGAQQISREAATPLTRNLLRQIRAPTKKKNNDDKTERSSESNAIAKQPTIKQQEVWDFDGTAIITAEAAAGAHDDVQALIFPNTDDKYTNDIETIDGAMGDRLFLLVNPFWRDVESWGFNLLSPNGKKRAQHVIFDRGYTETYVVAEKSVRGEDCIALKSYPYDWQLYAYAESDDWPYNEYIIHLGSTPEEPTAADFGKLIGERDEFKMSKNMRQMQRMMNNNDE